MSRPTRAGAFAVRVVGPSGWSSASRACCTRWTSWLLLTPAGILARRCGGPCKSTRDFADALAAQGFQVSDDTVGRLLKQQRYTLQRTQKTEEGAQHPDRDAQFRYLC